ncbi:hypothetical protein [Sphingomonas ginkgonis]|nr:hypothetical protein [Sphingomonas ginkgonis]
MRAIFPRGYVDHKIYRERLKAAAEGREQPVRLHESWRNPPCSAVDLFALAGSLLMRSGAYHHVSPEVPPLTPRSLTVAAADRDTWVRAGAEWRGTGEEELPPPPEALLAAWRILQRHLDEPLFVPIGPDTKYPSWWRAALSLFCIADEAAMDIGFEVAGKKSAQAVYVEFPIRRAIARERMAPRGAITFSRADADQICILPKSRTPKVGCTIRSLSHHLALLPGRGMARAYWRLAPSRSDQQEPAAERPFNVMVVPTPYCIRASAFSGHPAADASWGWFDVEPHWCAKSDYGQPLDGFGTFLEFIEALLARAEVDVGIVHALVLPEVALGSQVFRLLCEALQNRPGLELLVSGLFDQTVAGKAVRKGNFTGMARFLRSPSGTPSFDVSIREKHHRWRIEKSQITNYALGSALDVNRGWWERIDILSRSLDVMVLRGGATVTTLICEDLARSDPCQELVRGIGPNFVISLLMDGPQIASRWPARYATVLAEDPGSSVLTLSSLGLIQRSNDTGRFLPSRQIGLFQDDTGTLTEINLAPGAQAMCLTLQPSRVRERTLDGRHDEHGAESWKLSGVVPVGIEHPNEDIMAGRWPIPPRSGG